MFVQFYFDLIDYREKNNIKNAAIVRIEQLFPLPVKLIISEIKKLYEQGYRVGKLLLQFFDYDKNLFIDPFRPMSYYHKDCFIDILKNHPLSFVKLDYGYCRFTENVLTMTN